MPINSSLEYPLILHMASLKKVKLPKEFSVRGKVLEIFRRGDEIVLREPAKGLTRAFELLTSLPEDFLAEGRQDMPPQHREGL